MNVTLLASLLALTADCFQAAILRGGDLDALGGNALKTVALSPFSRSNSTDSTSSTVSTSSTSSTDSKKSGIESFKKLFTRKSYDMVSYPDGVFHSMKALAADRAYSIRIYRGHPETNRAPFFKSKSDEMSLQADQKRVLIQTYSDSDPQKKLCIMTQSTEIAKNNAALEQFTKAMIVLQLPEERDRVFKSRKNDLGLPGLTSNFSFDIYAWETDYDCALYNLGLPVEHFPPLPFKQAKTQIHTQVSMWRDVNYSVQTSETGVLDRPIFVLQVNKAETTVSRTGGNKIIRSKAENLKLQPIQENYSSMVLLFNQFSHLNAHNVELNNKCGAFFIDGGKINAPSGIAVELVQKLSELSTLFIFVDENDFQNFYGYFPESKTVTFAFWDKRNGSCNFPNPNQE